MHIPVSELVIPLSDLNKICICLILLLLVAILLERTTSKSKKIPVWLKTMNKLQRKEGSAPAATRINYAVILLGLTAAHKSPNCLSDQQHEQVPSVMRMMAKQ